MQFHEIYFVDLFYFTSFFAWTFLNFLARCGAWMHWENFEKSILFCFISRNNNDYFFFSWNWKFNNIRIIYFPDNRASLLRPGTAPKKPLNEKDISMHLWKNYIIFACRVVPPNPSPVIRCVSPDLMLSSSPESLSMITDRSADNKSPSPLIQPSVSNYFFREINSIAAIIIFNMPSLWQTSNFKNGIFVNINLS